MPGMQGRYWFGAVATMCVAVSLGWANIARRYQRWLPLGVLVSAGIMQVTAVRSIINQYWGAPNSAWSDRIRAMVAWAPLPGEMLAVGAVVGALVVLNTTRMLVFSDFRALPAGSAASLGSDPVEPQNGDDDPVMVQGRAPEVVASG
jgi:hypothetical protein